MEQTSTSTTVENKITADNFIGDSHEIKATDEKGKQIRFVLLTDSRIAKVREGKGKDVEKSTLEAGGDQSKYFSSMMASTIEIDGKGITMYDLGELAMKDYMRLQVAFADINF